MTPKNKKIDVQGREVVINTVNNEDYISITDIAKYKDEERTDYIIQNWLRNRNTIEFLGIWEKLNNPDFNPIEFEGFRNQAGLNSFVLTSKNGLNPPMQLALYLSQEDMVEHMHIKISHLNLHHGYRLSSSCIS